ncbi:High arsenic content 1 protein [Thalictrum thalictroides]|uniref:High arsenic content 1 protein n=1 Tax=Thalictrum thalictroides TaxID=46969 RepID=A0A7J6WYD2_THATH|nr:High arsenic content 1 protein [Thalictrum thalictroides]
MEDQKSSLQEGVCLMPLSSDVCLRKETDHKSSTAVATIDVHQANDLIHSAGYSYLDVRTTEEFNKDHVAVENVLNVPYIFKTPEGRVKNPQFLEQVMSACNKDVHLVVACQGGGRSLLASEELMNAGYEHVRNMGGGFSAWIENGLVTMKSKLIE